MRITLLLIIAAGTLWVGQELGFIADHYAHLEHVYLEGLDNADRALAYQVEQLRICRSGGKSCRL